MTFLDPKAIKPSRPQIDLGGPDGNAFVLMSLVRQYGKQLGWDKEEISSVINDMRSENYQHLVIVFHKHFGDYVDIVLPPNWTWEEKKQEFDPVNDSVSVSLQSPKVK